MQELCSTSVWVNSSRIILLQTAQALAFNHSSPRLSRRVRIVFDSSSQWSYVMERVVRELSLRLEGTQMMTILTFSSSQEHSQLCDYMRLGFELKNGQTKQLMLYTVPLISESQPLYLCQNRFDHIMDFDLADYSSDNNQLEVEILVGFDQYWDLATGEVRCGQTGPVAQQSTQIGPIGPCHVFRPDPSIHFPVLLVN